MESARLARRSDHPRIADLWALADDELGAQRGGMLLMRSLAPGGEGPGALGELLDDPERVVAVGTLDDVVVGFAVARTRTSATLAAERVGALDVVYVEAEARSVGVGEALVQLLSDRLAAAGCVGVDAMALPGNRDAKAFFETHGFVTRLLVMHRSTATAAAGRAGGGE